MLKRDYGVVNWLSNQRDLSLQLAASAGLSGSRCFNRDGDYQNSVLKSVERFHLIECQIMFSRSHLERVDHFGCDHLRMDPRGFP